MSNYEVMDCNDCRKAEELLRRLRKEHMDGKYYEQWGEDFGALLHAWSVMSVRLDRRRREVADLCAPWFEVAQ